MDDTIIIEETRHGVQTQVIKESEKLSEIIKQDKGQRSLVVDSRRTEGEGVLKRVEEVKPPALVYNDYKDDINDILDNLVSDCAVRDSPGICKENDTAEVIQSE